MASNWIVSIALAVAILVVLAALSAQRKLSIVRSVGASDAGRTANIQEIGASTILIGGWTLGFGVAGIAWIGVWSWGQAPSASALAIFGTDVIVAMAAAAVGALLGFIFGVPRTLDPSTRVAVAAASQSGPAASSQAALAANTNLERISDWLTTLLVGATLVQSEKVFAWLGTLGENFKDTDSLTNSALVPLIVIYFFALAFLGIYLVTRLYLTFALQNTLALLTGAVAPAVKIITTTLAPGEVGAAYGPATLQAVGGTSPLAWSVRPDLPAGLAINADTGAISGQPAAASTQSYVFTVTDGASPPSSASATVPLEIKAPASAP